MSEHVIERRPALHRCPGCGLKFWPDSLRARCIERLRIDGPMLSRQLAEALAVKSRRGLYDALAIATMRGDLAYAFVEANTKHIFGDGLVKVFGLPDDIRFLLDNQVGLPPDKSHWLHMHAIRHPGPRLRRFTRVTRHEMVACERTP